MTGQSISAHGDATTVAKLRQTATSEGRTPSHVIASSLKLYLALPGTVRAALRDIESLGTAEEQQNMIRAIARTVVSTQYDVARRRIAEGMQLDNEDMIETDEDIMAEAVRVTTKGC